MVLNTIKIFQSKGCMNNIIKYFDILGVHVIKYSNLQGVRFYQNIAIYRVNNIIKFCDIQGRVYLSSNILINRVSIQLYQNNSIYRVSNIIKTLQSTCECGHFWTLSKWWCSSFTREFQVSPLVWWKSKVRFQLNRRYNFVPT